ncbi:MAG: hypothetical protein IJF72_03750 [Clostridia bacterium]|nr:hypothetical protein [Clostridia bacterium]
MTKFFALVKAMFLNQQRASTFKSKASNKKGVSTRLILGIVFAPLLMLMAVQTYFVGTLSDATIQKEVISVLMGACQGMVFMFSIPSMLNVVFSCNDAERLLSMPVKPITIFTAKLTLVYLYELATSLVMSLFLILPFGIGAGLGVQFYFFLIVAVVIIPLLPLLLVAIVCFPFAYLSNYLQGKGFAKTLVTTLFFLVVMGAYFALVLSFGSMEGSDQMDFSDLAVLLVNLFSQNSQKISTFAFFNYWLATAMVSTNFVEIILNFLATLGLNLVSLALAVLLSNLLYKKMLSKSLEKTSKKAKDTRFLQEKQSNKLLTLAMCDLKRLLRESQMGFQVLAMPILIPIIMAVLCFALTTDGINQQLNFSDPFYSNLMLIMVVFYNLVIGISGNVLAMYPISRERTSFFMMKTMPVSLKTQLNAKLLLSTAMITISYLATAVICVTVLPIEWYFVFVLALLPIIFSFGSSCVTMLLDLRKPILDWTNFQTSLKNSPNTWWTMLIALCLLFATLIVAGLFVALYQVAQIDLFWLMYVVLIVLGIVYSLIAHSILMKNSKKYFDRIEI